MWETVHISVHKNINMCILTFQVLRLSTFVFNKCSEQKMFTIIFVGEGFKDFG